MNRTKPFRGLLFAKGIPTPGFPFDCNCEEGNIITSEVMSVTLITTHGRMEYLVETKNSLYVLILTDLGLPWI